MKWPILTGLILGAVFGHFVVWPAIKGLRTQSPSPSSTIVIEVPTGWTVTTKEQGVYQVVPLTGTPTPTK